MLPRYLAWTLVILCVTGSLRARAASLEERINEAVPLSVDAEALIAAYHRENMDLATRSRFDKSLALKLRLRALTCAQKLAIDDSLKVASIRAAFGQNPCFSSEDSSIAAWAGLSRVGLVLALPPLRPIPSKPAARIERAAYPLFVLSYASDSGIALRETSAELETLDLGSGEVLSRYTMTRPRLAGNLSPNGRIFVESEKNVLVFRSTESGSVIARAAWCRPVLSCSISWLSDHLALISHPDSGEPAIYDFRSDRLIPTDLYVNDQVLGHYPNRPAEFVSSSLSAVIHWRVEAKGDSLRYQRISSVKSPASYIGNQSCDRLTADGGTILNVSNGRLNVVTLESLVVEAVDFGPFKVSCAIATRNPDIVILEGFVGRNYGATRLYQYSLGERTMAAITSPLALGQWLSFARPVSTLYMVTGPNMNESDLTVGPSESLESFRTHVSADFQPRAEDATGQVPLGGPALQTEPHVDSAEARRVAEVSTQVLKAQDRMLNETYQRVMANLSPRARDSLRNEQRAWLATRNIECKLDEQRLRAPDWQSKVATSPAKAACVTRATNLRLASLREREHAELAKSSPQARAPVVARLSISDTAGSVSMGGAHSAGKWYFELVIDRVKAKRHGPQLISISLYAGEHRLLTNMVPVRASDLGSTTVDMAIDLDDYVVYTRQDGSWRSGAPDDHHGKDISRDSPVTVLLNSTAPTADLLSDGSILFNPGTSIFRFPSPAGFKSWNEPPAARTSAQPASRKPIRPDEVRRAAATISGAALPQSAREDTGNCVGQKLYSAVS